MMNMRIFAPMSLLLAAACGQVHVYDTSGWNVEDEVVDTATDASAAPLGELEVTGVWPPFGSDAGGSTVRIVGGPFEGFATVTIDGEEATVLSSTPEELVISTPPGVEGVAELIVTSDGAASTHSFRYWADASGMVGLKGAIEFVDVVGNYWADGGYDRARAEISLIEPVEFESWEAFSRSYNSCTSDWTLPRDVPVDGMDDVVLVSSDIRVDLEEDGDGFVGDQGVAPGEMYGLETAGEWDGVVLDDLVEVPPGLRVSAPVLDGDAPKKVDRQFELTWDRNAPADYVAIVMERSHLEPNGSLTIEQKVSCAVPDSGSFTVPGTMWNEWRSDDVITVSIGRVYEGNGVVLPHNNAESGVVGIYWVSGAVRAK